jgi:hypothetical protein
MRSYYMGFYCEGDTKIDGNKCLPKYSLGSLTISNKIIEHSIITEGGSSGGPLIYSLQIGSN